MSVKAKFKVNRIERSHIHRYRPGDQHPSPAEMQTVVLSPVYANGDPQHENSKFWDATPSGEIKLGMVNAEAGNYFELGQEYYIDFTKA